MRRHSALGSGLAALIALAAVPAASAQDPVIQAVDDLAGPNNRWEPSAVTVNVGGTVTWRYEGTLLAHNVKSSSANWDVDTPTSTQDGRPVTLGFSAEGTYDFVCKFHADTMKGTVTVGTPPPPPPPPLSEQPFLNDQQTPTVLDVADWRPPRLSRVRVAAVHNGARVRMRLSERARVRVRFKRAGIVIRTERRIFRKGVHSLTVRDPRMRGSYQVEVVARDLAGNRSRMKRLRVRVP